MIIRNIKLGLYKLVTVVGAFATTILMEFLTSDDKLAQGENVQLGDVTLEGTKVMDWVYSTCLIVVMVLIIIASNQFRWELSKMNYEVGTVLRYLIYSKMLRAADVEGGEEQANIVNLINGDVFNMNEFWESLHETWACLATLFVTVIIVFLRV
jgi:hypothetical protein